MVTPYVGVWIETTWPSANNGGFPVSHPTCVCGLKLEPIDSTQPDVRHTLRGCVDWNFNTGISSRINRVTPYVGVWIETSMAQYSAISKMVTPCVGIYGLEHCSLVGQVYGRTVSIRPLMYFSPGFWFCYDWKKHVQARMLIFCLSSFVVSPRWQYIGT